MLLSFLQPFSESEEVHTVIHTHTHTHTHTHSYTHTHTHTHTHTPHTPHTHTHSYTHTHTHTHSYTHTVIYTLDPFTTRVIKTVSFILHKERLAVLNCTIYTGNHPTMYIQV